MIGEQSQNHGVAKLCRVLGVSRSAYYDYVRGNTYREKPDQIKLMHAVSRVFSEHKRRYGSRRIFHALRKEGIRVGRHKVRRIMSGEGLRALQPSSFVSKTTQSGHRLGYAPNLLKDRPLPEEVDKIYVGDISYLPCTSKRWLYVNVWIDLFSRRIVGWKVGEYMDDQIVVLSLQTALEKRKVGKELIVHSDRGGQYRAKTFKQLLRQWGCIQSMSDPDIVYDNAFSESLFGRLKTEMQIGKKKFKDVREAEKELFEYIEGYYNRQRLHSSLGYQSPEEFEKLNR